MSRPTLSDWEHGRGEPRLSNLLRIAAMTGQPLDWFAEAFLEPPVGIEPTTFSLQGRELTLADLEAIWAAADVLAGVGR